MSDEPLTEPCDVQLSGEFQEFRLKKRSEPDAILHLSKQVNELQDFIASLNIQPEILTVKCGHIEITGDGIRGEVRLDGAAVNRLMSYELRHSAGSLPQLTLHVE